jgi:hypothetical protein
VCTRCRRTYYTTRHLATTCYECYYVGAHVEAEERFAMLTVELAKRLEVMPDVWQTGGMVMCLHVPMPDGMYALFSELCEYDPGDIYFGVYREVADGDGFTDTEDVAMHSRDFDLSELGVGEDDDPPRAVAEWAAPLILAHLR